jgi:riboflavin kinase/FMN adenylyltransferase
MCYFCASFSIVKIFDGLEADIQIPKAHLTIGTFDGVHIGHQKIIGQLNQRAQENQGESVLFTFDPHPRMVLNPNEPVPLLQTRQEKLDKLERLGLQNVILFPFTKSFSQTPAEEFIRTFLVEKLKMNAVIIGYDHQFGRNREGSLEHFQVLGKALKFAVEEIPAQDIDDIHVSSTKIRTALQQGEVHIANKYLGEPFQLNGLVVHGQALGKSLGFPTANILIDNPYKILPKSGVYLVRCSVLGENYFGMMNIGNRPTIASLRGQKLSIEIHIFDFRKDIYDQSLQVELLQFIREETKFTSNNALAAQLKKDENFCRDTARLYSLQPYTL